MNSLKEMICLENTIFFITVLYLSCHWILKIFAKNLCKEEDTQKKKLQPEGVRMEIKKHFLMVKPT